MNVLKLSEIGQKMIRPRLLIILLMSTAVCGQIKLDGSGKDGQKMMSFKTPELNEEENQSTFMPEHLKCDGCNAIAFQFHKHFEEFNNKHKHYNYKLPESEIIELVERVCHHDTFNNYGIKEVDGVKKLSGEGLAAENEMGILAGGGRWPGRLSSMCATYVEELYETGIYDLYQNGKTNAKKFQLLLCHGEGVLGKCSKKRKNKKKIHTEL